MSNWIKKTDVRKVLDKGKVVKQKLMLNRKFQDTESNLDIVRQKLLETKETPDKGSKKAVAVKVKGKKIISLMKKFEG